MSCCGASVRSRHKLRFPEHPLPGRYQGQADIVQPHSASLFYECTSWRGSSSGGMAAVTTLSQCALAHQLAHQTAVCESGQALRRLARMAFLQGTDGNDVLGGTKLDEPLLGPVAIPALLAFGGSDHVFGDQLSVPVLPLLTPARIDQRWSLVFVSDVLAPGVSPMAESREHGGATYAVA